MESEHVRRAPISPEAFKAEVERWAQRIKTQPHQVRLQRMTRKWASRSPQGRICFNTDMLAQPRGFRDYVIVHELLHLKVPNHGKLFKSLMRAYLPRAAALTDDMTGTMFRRI